MTFTIDCISLCLGIGTIVLAILGCLVNPLFRGLRFPKSADDDEASANSEPTPEGRAVGMEPVSVLLTVHDNSDTLERNVQAFLEQDYPDFQVIVVGESGDTATEDIMKRLSARYPHLYYTMIPSSSRYMSRKKLQITLGVKASRHEWIVLTEPNCYPEGKDWLRKMAGNFTEENKLVLGVVLPDAETAGYHRFRHIRTLYYLLRRAQRDVALRSHMPNIAFRKSMFVGGKGFQGNLQLIRGELDFLVNKYADDASTAVELSPLAWLTEEVLTRKTRINRRLYLIASRKYLLRMSSMRVLCFFDHFFPWLSLLVSVGVLVYALLFANWLPSALAVVALLVLFLGRMYIAGRAVRHFDDHLSFFLLPFYELRLIWSDLAYRLRYLRSDKNDFTSHKQ